MDEPTITRAECRELFRAEGESSNLTHLKDNTGAMFLVRNHGVSDDGENLNLEIIGRIVDWDDDELHIKVTPL